MEAKQVHNTHQEEIQSAKLRLKKAPARSANTGIILASLNSLLNRKTVSKNTETITKQEILSNTSINRADIDLSSKNEFQFHKVSVDAPVGDKMATFFANILKAVERFLLKLFTSDNDISLLNFPLLTTKKNKDKEDEKDSVV